LIKKFTKLHINTVGAMYSTLQKTFLWFPPFGRNSSPICASPPGHSGTLFNTKIQY
jgi:hypothetical protein